MARALLAWRAPQGQGLSAGRALRARSGQLPLPGFISRCIWLCPQFRPHRTLPGTRRPGLPPSEAPLLNQHTFPGFTRSDQAPSPSGVTGLPSPARPVPGADAVSQHPHFQPHGGSMGSGGCLLRDWCTDGDSSVFAGQTRHLVVYRFAWHRLKAPSPGVFSVNSQSDRCMGGLSDTGAGPRARTPSTHPGSCERSLSPRVPGLHPFLPWQPSFEDLLGFSSPPGGPG